MPDYCALLGEIETACTKAGRKALEMQPQIDREIKPDGSIVTDADRVVERDLRETIEKLTPGAAVWGEEFGYSAPTSAGFWTIDPVDGTSNYAFGQPLWGVTAAYYHEGSLRLGVISLPSMGWTLTAARGSGAFLNGKRLEAVKPGAIMAYDLVGFGDVLMADRYGYPGKVRHHGSFVVEAALFVTGGLRALVTDRVCLYDAAAGVVLAREVGAEVRELDGSVWDESLWTKPSTCRPFGFFPAESGWNFQSQ